MSQRRFIEIFRNEVGVTPKAFSRLRRFQHVLGAVEHLTDVDWTDVAVECGYFDQAHFIHDFREFAGVTPSLYLPLPRVAESHRRSRLTVGQILTSGAAGSGAECADGAERPRRVEVLCRPCRRLIRVSRLRGGWCCCCAVSLPPCSPSRRERSSPPCRRGPASRGRSRSSALSSCCCRCCAPIHTRRRRQSRRHDGRLAVRPPDRACVRPPGMGHLEDPKLTADLTVARDFDLGMTGPPLNVSSISSRAVSSRWSVGSHWRSSSSALCLVGAHRARRRVDRDALSAARERRLVRSQHRRSPQRPARRRLRLQPRGRSAREQGASALRACRLGHRPLYQPAHPTARAAVSSDASTRTSVVLEPLARRRPPTSPFSG